MTSERFIGHIIGGDMDRNTVVLQVAEPATVKGMTIGDEAEVLTLQAEIARLTAMVEEQRLTLLAEHGRSDGAVSDGWGYSIDAAAWVKNINSPEPDDFPRTLLVKVNWTPLGCHNGWIATRVFWKGGCHRIEEWVDFRMTAREAMISADAAL